MRVSDVMTEDPLWVETTTTIGEVVAKLDDSLIRHLPVLREGVVVGILSDRDLRSSLPSLDMLSEDPERFGTALATPVGEVMTRAVATVDPDRDLRDVVDLMLQHHIGAIVVTDPQSDKLVGMVSYVDALRAARDMLWG